MEEQETLTEAVRVLLAGGQYRQDNPDVPFSGMAGIIADRLWELGYRQTVTSANPVNLELAMAIAQESDRMSGSIIERLVHEIKELRGED